MSQKGALAFKWSLRIGIGAVANVQLPSILFVDQLLFIWIPLVCQFSTKTGSAYSQLDHCLVHAQLTTHSLWPVARGLCRTSFCITPKSVSRLVSHEKKASGTPGSAAKAAKRKLRNDRFMPGSAERYHVGCCFELPGVFMTLSKWVHDPIILGNDPVL